MSDVKKMSIKEFRELGYMQEINRHFLHPLGLALESTIAEDGTETIKAVWDCRDQEEGLLYDPTLLSPEKTEYVYNQRKDRLGKRLSILGFVIQPD